MMKKWRDKILRMGSTLSVARADDVAIGGERGRADKSHSPTEDVMQSMASGGIPLAVAVLSI